MKTQCPHCQAYFNIKPEYVGKRTKCKNCGRGFLIAEASEIKAPAPSPAPAKITRFASVSSLARTGAEKKAESVSPATAVEEAGEGPEVQTAAGESSAIPEIRISIEGLEEVPEIQFKTEVEPLAGPETKVAAEESPEVPAVQERLEEPGERPEVQFTAEAAPDLNETGTAAAETARLEAGPRSDGDELKITAPISIPELVKPSAVQAQIYEALKSSRPSAPPNPIPTATVPAFQPVSAAQAAAYGPPVPEWAAGASLGAAHPGTGLGASAPAFPAGGYPGAAVGYGTAPPFPAAAYPASPQPSSVSPARAGLPPKNGQAEGAAGSVGGPVPTFGPPLSPQRPPNGGGFPSANAGPAATGSPVHGQAGLRPRAGERTAIHSADQLDEGLIKRYLKRVPRALWIAAAVALFVGGMAGAKISSLAGRAEIRSLEASVAQAQQQLQTQKDERVESLKKERQRLRQDLSRVDSYSQDYPEGSIPRALALAAAEEFKIADTLLLQQIAAAESGAKVTISVKQTRPDPELAATLEAEMIKLEEEIARQWQEAKELEETPKMLATTGIATQMVSLAILNRNLLIARYGLSSPVPLQYRSPGPPNQTEPAPTAAPPESPAGSGPASNGGDDKIPAELERLKKENERLLAENELLLNSDSTIYASAVSDLGSGRLIPAEEKFKRLLAMFPTSPLAPKATEGLAEIKVQAKEKEAAKKPPVEISATGVKHDGGYFRNQTYIRVSFKNISPLMIKRLEFKVLTFDEHGYPIASKRLDITQDNFFTAAMTENIAPGRSDYGVWELSEKVRQVKVKLKAVEFYDAPPWRDEDIEFWVEKEGGRYEVKGKAG